MCVCVRVCEYVCSFVCMYVCIYYLHVYFIPSVCRFRSESRHISPTTELASVC